MTKEELIALIRDPNQTGQAVDELNRLIEAYPYFHAGRQLYLKGLQQTDTGKMALQLSKTALCVRDRDVLYHYLHPPSVYRQPPLPNPDAERKNTEERIISEEKSMSDEDLMEIIRRQLNQIEDVQKNESKTNDDLIDAFLQSNPKIVPGNHSYEVDLSESLQENMDNATDTLAEIYAEQGHIDKAIEIYEHLILKYPEKHIYFAAQIERLNDRLKDKN